MSSIDDAAAAASVKAPEQAVAGQVQRKRRRSRWVAVAILTAHTLGFISSIQALMTARTSQGAIAWIVSLNGFPYLTVPAYWVFGRSKFQGYVIGRRTEDTQLGQVLAAKLAAAVPHRAELEDMRGGLQALERLADLPFLADNEVELLVDGDATFASVFAGIEQARDYLLVQSYIIKHDGLGRRLGEALARRAREGVRVFLLYDEIGSRKLSEDFVRDLSREGVQVRRFHSTRGGGNRFQLNFRNHRKIVVADGRFGWVGGFNVGDEYLGLDPAIGPWRDTHLRVEGPAVLGLQLSFMEDWHWATDEVLDLAWTPRPTPAGRSAVLILPSGPADRFETASLMIQDALHSARRRIWFASPYFVPDEAVMGALKLAALRGVDVRVLIPERTNDLLVHSAQYAFLGSLLESGVQILRYSGAFLHQKVFLVDNDVASIGTVNLDNRSFRLNFEVTALVVDPGLAAQVERMLENDLSHARGMTTLEVENRSAWARLASRAAYLTAPIL